MIAAMGFGFLSTLDSFPLVFAALKIAGSLYVLWIAWELLRAGALEGYETASPATFFDGVVPLVFNPKAYVIIALVFTQFLKPSDDNWLSAIILITTVFSLNNLIAFSL